VQAVKRYGTGNSPDVVPVKKNSAVPYKGKTPDY